MDRQLFLGDSEAVSFTENFGMVKKPLKKQQRQGNSKNSYCRCYFLCYN